MNESVLRPNDPEAVATRKKAMATAVQVAPDYGANGAVHEEIIAVSRKAKCDLIVIESHRPELSP